MKQLIVCADDFGLTEQVNQAVEAACRDGILTVAKLMVGEAASADAVARARALPQLKVGLHIVLVDGVPVSDPAEVSDLLGPDGRFSLEQARQGFRFFFKPGVRSQLRREITAQFDAFAATGLPLDHVNCHKHMHLHPTVAALIIEIGRGYGMRALRVPLEPPDKIETAEPDREIGLGPRLLNIWSQVLRRQIERADMIANDWTFGLAWSGGMTEERVLALLRHLPDGVSEMYFHPATARDETLKTLMPDYRHEAEFAALISPAIKARLAESGIALVSYSDLQPPEPWAMRKRRRKRAA